MSLQDSIIEEVTQDHGPRLCTVLLYLNDVPEGGETAFAGTGERLQQFSYAFLIKKFLT
jgi:hypothetical protein